jgi:hypothetical protein
LLKEWSLPTQLARRTDGAVRVCHLSRLLSAITASSAPGLRRRARIVSRYSRSVRVLRNTVRQRLAELLLITEADDLC